MKRMLWKVKTGALRIESEKNSKCLRKGSRKATFWAIFKTEMPAQGGHDIALADLFIAFLFSVGLGDVHEGGGKCVIGDEGCCKTKDGKQSDVVQCAHWAEDEHEEHRAQNECCHAHRLSDFAVRKQQRFFVAACAFITVFDVVVHVDGIVNGDAQNHRHHNHRYHVERHSRIAHNATD